jgi:hypothetical protein
VAYEGQPNEKGECIIFLDDRMADRLSAMRGPGESYSEVIIRLAEVGHEHVAGPAAQASFVYSCLGECVIFNTAWIDRPVDTRGLHSLLPRLPKCSMVMQPCPSHRDPATWRTRH